MEVPHFNLKLDPDNFNESIKPILKQVRPEWNMDEVHFEAFTEGISNKLAGCSPPGRQRSSETILFRLYGNKTELFIDRQAELETFKIFLSHGFGPAVEGTFENGLCYGFLEGPVVDCHNIRDSHVSVLIARHMARSHAIKLPANSRHKSEASLFPTIEKFIKSFPGEFTQPEKQSRYLKELGKLNSHEKLFLEMESLKAALLRHNPPVMFCHNDLLCNNIVYNKEKDQVRWIDYEYASMNYLPHDIGNHFCEYAGVDEVDYDKYPAKDYQLRWLRTYLEETAKIKGETDPTISPMEVEKLYVQVNQFALAAHFFWGVWALLQASFSDIDFDFLGYAVIRFDEYFRRKPEFLSLTCDYD